MKYWGLIVFGIATGLFAALSAGAGTTSTLLGLLFGALGGSLVSWFSKQAGGRRKPRGEDGNGAQTAPVIDVGELNAAVGKLASGLLVGLVLGLAWPTVDMYCFMGTRATAQANAIAGAWEKLPEEVRRNPEVAKELVEKTSEDLPTSRPQAFSLNDTVALHKATISIQEKFASTLEGDTKTAMDELQGHVAYLRYRADRIQKIQAWIEANPAAANTGKFADTFQSFIDQEPQPR